MESNEASGKIANLLWEIKRREHASLVFQKERHRLLFGAISIEAVYLQYRKILELIAFAAVIANARAYG